MRVEVKYSVCLLSVDSVVIFSGSWTFCRCDTVHSLDAFGIVTLCRYRNCEEPGTVFGLCHDVKTVTYGQETQQKHMYTI